LRFRLTASYALFFALLLVGVAALFRERLATVLTEQAHAVLNQEWATMKAYLRVEPNSRTRRNEAYWYYDPLDNEESRVVLNIKRAYAITDREGRVIVENATQAEAISPAYAELGLESPAEISAKVKRALSASKPNSEPMTFWMVRTNARGDRYLVRSGVVFDDPPGERRSSGGAARRGDLPVQTPYYVSLAAPLRQYGNILREFTWLNITVIPSALIVGSLLGWVVAGRALKPVRSVAVAAQRISGSNLSLRIPTRDAGDELDYLIRTFNRMVERLESSFKQMKQFSADVSHELRTPITAIRGQLEVALFTAQTTDQYREAMFNALQDIDRLSQIVRALLLLSQAESGQLALQKANANLSGIVKDVVEQFQIPAEAAGVKLTAETQPECIAEVDRVQIERMLTNLLSNALKFTPPGGSVNVTVRYGAPKQEGERPREIELVVEDTGRGIAAEFLPHIFNRFYRVPGPGAAPGSEQGLGLGLSFVAWIVKAHKGTIDVQSEPGNGARFTVKLPTPGMASDTVEIPGRVVR
jgi:heavy metal sensor kinase